MKSKKKYFILKNLKAKNSRTPLQSFFGIAEDEVRKTPDLTLNDKSPTSIEYVSVDDKSPTDSSGSDKPALTPEEYFSDIDLQGQDIGRSKKIQNKVKHTYIYILHIIKK